MRKLPIGIEKVPSRETQRPSSYSGLCMKRVWALEKISMRPKNGSVKPKNRGIIKLSKYVE